MLVTVLVILMSFQVQKIQAKTAKFTITLEGGGGLGIVESGKSGSISWTTIYSGEKVKAGEKILIKPLEDTPKRTFTNVQVLSGNISLESSKYGVTFIMPESDVKVKTVYNYADDCNFVTVSGGNQGTEWGDERETAHIIGDSTFYEVWPWHSFYSTDGCYEVGEKVYIEAKNPYTSKKRFKKWEVVSGNVTLADENAYFTSFVMPDASVKIKAVYEDVPKNGTVFKYKGNTYKVTYLMAYQEPKYSGVIEVSLTKAKKNTKNLKLPQYVYYNGVKCEVTSLASDSISACKKTLTGVTIPASVYELESGTFSGCKKLKKVVLKHTKDVEFFCWASSGSLINISGQAVVYVDKGSLKKYRKYMYKGDKNILPVIDKTTKIKAM
jgi:hypothetical protein